MQNTVSKVLNTRHFSYMLHFGRQAYGVAIGFSPRPSGYATKSTPVSPGFHKFLLINAKASVTKTVDSD